MINALDCPLHIFHHRVDITASETKAIQHERCRKTVRVAHFTDDVIQTKKATASFRCSFTFYSTNRGGGQNQKFDSLFFQNYP